VSKIGVIGIGYVGLTTALGFASRGNLVTCIDIDIERIDKLKLGISPIVESGLDELLRSCSLAHSITFQSFFDETIGELDFIILCVPTPQNQDGTADMGSIRSAIHSLSPFLHKQTIIITKSTVPVGSTKIIEELLPPGSMGVVSNPEFLREGSAIHDFLHPDRIVIGSDDRDSAARVAELYCDFQSPIVLTDPATAETIKYVANAFLATKLSFVNAIAALSEAVGANIEHLTTAVGLDKRIGADFLQPGPGWGGSCFPKDTAALIKIAERHGYDFSFLKSVIQINEEQFTRVFNKVAGLLSGSLISKKIAVWGLTFKAETDDIRDSPALKIVRLLLNSGAHISAFDPTVRSTLKNFEEVDVSSSPIAACEKADLLLVTTEWKTFSEQIPNSIGKQMALRNVVDSRNILDPPKWKQAGFIYRGIGR